MVRSRHRPITRDRIGKRMRSEVDVVVTRMICVMESSNRLVTVFCQIYNSFKYELKFHVSLIVWNSCTPMHCTGTCPKWNFHKIVLYSCIISLNQNSGASFIQMLWFLSKLFSVLIVWKSFSFKITYVTKVMVWGTVNNEAHCYSLSLKKENKVGVAVVTI